MCETAEKLANENVITIVALRMVKATRLTINISLRKSILIFPEKYKKDKKIGKRIIVVCFVKKVNVKLVRRIYKSLLRLRSTKL